MASQGPLYPGTTANLIEASTLENKDAWVNPGNVVSDNASEAQITAASYDSPDISQILVASNFGFTIPAGATIDGIVVEIDRRSIVANSGKDFRVQLAKGTTFASLVGSNKAVPATIWPTTSTVATYGTGTTDKWGTTWTQAEVNASSFAVFLSAQANIANADIGVDFIRVTVHYTAGGPQQYDQGVSGGLSFSGSLTTLPIQTRYISPTGNDTTGDGTQATPWATISKANTSAPAGATVIMRGGTYGPSGQITKRLHFEPFPSELPVVDAAGAGVQVWDVRAGGSGVSVTGVRMTSNTGAFHGIYVDGVTAAGGGYLIEDCRAHNVGHSGLNIIRSASVTVVGGEFDNNPWCGIRELGNTGGQDVTIDGAHVHDNGKGNGAGSGGDGILVQGLRTIVRNCQIDDNGDDTTLEHGIYLANPARDYLVEENVGVGNAASGIKADGGGEIRFNNFTGARQGLALDGTPAVLVDIHDNTFGGTLYSVLVASTATAITNHARWELDFNTYLTDLFSSNVPTAGTLETFAQWQGNSSQDANSTLSAGNQFTQGVSGSLSFAGATTKRAGKALAGALTFAGSVARRGGKALAGALTFSGSAAKRTSRTTTGGLTFTGSAARRLARSVTGSLSFAGTISTTRVLVRSLTAQLSFSGSVVKRSVRGLAGSLSFSGAVTRAAQRLRSLVGSVAFSGTVSSTKVLVRALSGSLAFAGALSRTNLYQRTLAAAVGLSGALSRASRRTLAASLGSSGVVSRATQRLRAFSAGLTFTGGVSSLKVLVRSLTGQLSFTGAIGRRTARPLSGQIAPIGQLGRAAQLLRTLTAGLTFSGQVTRATARLRSLASSLAFNAALTSQSIVVRVFQAGLAFSGTTTRRVGRSLSAALSLAGSMIGRNTAVSAIVGLVKVRGRVVRARAGVAKIVSPRGGGRIVSPRGDVVDISPHTEED